MTNQIILWDGKAILVEQVINVTAGSSLFLECLSVVANNTHRRGWGSRRLAGARGGGKENEKVLLLDWMAQYLCWIRCAQV